MSQKPSADEPDSLILSGLDGTNPLGFLAALGVMQTLTEAFPRRCIQMGWRQTHTGCQPLIKGVSFDISQLGSCLARHLEIPFQPNAKAEHEMSLAQKKMDGAKKEIKEAQERIKKSGSRGKQRDELKEDWLSPPQKKWSRYRDGWLQKLALCSPSAEMALGKHLNATGIEMNRFAASSCVRASAGNRRVTDLLSAFGAGVCADEETGVMKHTPFCFITGSGHQYFLATARKLFCEVDAERIQQALTMPSMRRDEKLSMRWEPVEDRRYAHMSRDPTASNNKAMTNWALNLLGYLGLQCLPSVPQADRLETTGWSSTTKKTWTWPIWEELTGSSVICSLLSHRELQSRPVDCQMLSQLGVSSVYQAMRIQVGNPPLHKLNFAPSRRIG